MAASPCALLPTTPRAGRPLLSPPALGERRSMRVAIEDQIAAGILACGHALCRFASRSTSASERNHLRIGGTPSLSGMGAFGCAVAGEITRNPDPVIVLAPSRCSWTIFLLPPQNMN
jgi:hypothetical protein